MTPVILWTDLAYGFLLLMISAVLLHGAFVARPGGAFTRFLKRPVAVFSTILLVCFLFVGALDSLHYQDITSVTGDAKMIESASPLRSVLDDLIFPIGAHEEKTYSAPLSFHLYVKESARLPNGVIVHEYPHLDYAAWGITTDAQCNALILHDVLTGFLSGAVFFSLLLILIMAALSWQQRCPLINMGIRLFKGDTAFPWRTCLITAFIIIQCVMIAKILAGDFHVLGTDKVGQDVFYQTIKSIRTGLVIGMLSTLIMLPFAIILGLLAGYFGGRTDDVIQYLYTTLSSIPGVLLIAASVLCLQVYISNHAADFPIFEERADARLFALCAILGVTSWTSLCRLLRAETLKLREMDFVHAAIAQGVSHARILRQHVLPNVFHVVLITVALDFSGLVLAEAVLSYVGVGVSSTTLSWGNMINSARLELARDPIVWWPIFAAFIVMFALVLSANLFADALRDTLDPRS